VLYIPETPRRRHRWRSGQHAETNLAVDVEVMNALLLPIVLGLLPRTTWLSRC